MSRRAVSALLFVYFTVVLFGVVFQIDRFPLTWVPMYAVWSPDAEPDPDPNAVDKVKVKDIPEATKGFHATHLDGSQSRVGIAELNIARRNMWRLYYERIYGKSPPKYKHANRGLDALSRWGRGLEEGEPVLEAEWPRRLFYSVNRTLGHEPRDPGFVVKLQAFQEIKYFNSDFELVRQRTRNERIRWRDEWAVDFQ